MCSGGVCIMLDHGNGARLTDRAIAGDESGDALDAWLVGLLAGSADLPAEEATEPPAT